MVVWVHAACFSGVVCVSRSTVVCVFHVCHCVLLELPGKPEPTVVWLRQHRIDAYPMPSSLNGFVFHGM